MFGARTEDNKRYPIMAVELVQRANLEVGWSMLELAMSYVDSKSLEISKRLQAWLKPGGISADNTHQV